ncbi:MAG: hypothetical protein IH991_05830 [Planctomycetes bacterium]|nr:hypothetical protein [Planctomycetota bacterium]
MIQGSRSSGGRRPRGPDSIADALAQIVKMSERWGRWYEGYDSTERKDKAPAKNRIEVDDLPESIGKSLKRVSGQIRKLKMAVEQELKPSTSSARTRKRR